MTDKTKCRLSKMIKWEFWISVLEFVILIALLVWAAFAPRRELYIGCDAFCAAGIGNGAYNGEIITMNDVPAQSLSVWGYHLKGGAYEMNVRYRSEVKNSRDFQNAVAVVQVESDWPIKFNEFQLRDQQQTAQGRLWIPYGSDCRDLKISIWYRGTGLLELESIHFVENRAYRYAVIAGIVLTMLMVNWLYLAFFSKTGRMLHKNRTLFVLLGITFAASLPMLTDFIGEGHDLFFHLERIVLLAEEFKNGQFPVRMFTTANNYYGYPTPIFYCDLFLYLPALLYWCMVPLQTCYRLYIIMLHAVTCGIAYYCFFRITKQRNLSLLGAALYTLCNIRVVHFTVRAAVGEYSAMTFLPLILLGIHEIYSKEKLKAGDWLPLSLGMLGVVFSHMITTELVVIDLVVFCLVLMPKTFRPNRLAAILKAASLCLLMCAWFIVPFLDYYMTQNTSIGNQVYMLQPRGVYLIQLLGLFLTGSGHTNMNHMLGSMPLSIGFSLTLGIVLILICMFKRENWKCCEEKNYVVWVSFFLIAVMNLFLILQQFPWTVIQLRLGVEAGQLGQYIGSIQFPWRLLTPASALLAFSSILVLAVIKKNAYGVYQCSCAALILALAVSTGYLYYQYSNAAFPFRTYSQPIDKYMDDLYLLEGTENGDHLWSEVIVKEGRAQIEDYWKEKGTAYLRVQNDTDEHAKVTLPIYAYRHYKAMNEVGEEIPILIDESNCVSLEIAPNYDGEITIKFVSPPYWRVAEVISLLTMLALASTGILRWTQHRKRLSIGV